MEAALPRNAMPAARSVDMPHQAGAMESRGRAASARHVRHVQQRQRQTGRCRCRCVDESKERGPAPGRDGAAGEGQQRQCCPATEPHALREYA